ncbi:pH-response regulator protein palA/rim20, partial [Tulasnella sp. 427]
LYQDRLSNYIKENIVDVQQDLDVNISMKLHELSLPAALDALDKKIGLPPSLTAKATEVRQNGGNKKIESAIQDVATLSNHCKDAIHAAAKILEMESQQDAVFQMTFANHPTIVRDPSNLANHALLQETVKFQQAFMTASESDGQIRQSWGQWRPMIDLLAGSDAGMEAAVPSSRSTGLASATVLPHARELRRLLEELDDLKTSRAEIVEQARHLADIDDIRRRIELEASAMERWVEVKPAMFEDTIASELDKYEKYRNQLDEGATKQAVLLEKIEAANPRFIESRKKDPGVEQREKALATLYTGYSEYKKTLDDLSQGLEFYNKLSVVTTQLAEKCRVWAAERDAEVK